MRISRSTTAARRRGIALVAAILGLAPLLVGITGGAAQADGLTWQVTNNDHDTTKGVYLRNSSDVNNVTRDSAQYLTYGVSVQLLCAESGSVVGPNNSAWDYVRVVDGPNAGKTGHLSEHWLNTPVSANQHVAGEPVCGAQPTTPTTTPTNPPPATSAKTAQAIAYARSKVGSTSYNGLCLTLVNEAWRSAGVDIKAQTNLGSSWNRNTYPDDVWGRITSGRKGVGTPPAGALVFYLSTNNRGKTYSHITIAVDGGNNTVSSNDTFNKKAVHYETLKQHADARPFNRYVGWWMPAN